MKDNYVTMAVEAAKEKKAQHIVIMGMKELTPVVDYHVVCEAPNKRQVQAVADNIDSVLSENGLRPLRVEGYREGRWVLLDFGSFVAHVFHTDDRKFYDIEGLWSDAEFVHAD